MMTVELVNRREDLARLAPRWDELAYCDSRDGFFRTSAWYTTWMDDVRPDAQPFVIVVRDASGRVVGIAPLSRAKYRDRWLPMDAVSFGGREVVSGDYLDYIAAPHARAEVISAILEFLWEKRSRWGLLVLGELFENGDLYNAALSFFGSRGLNLRRQEERFCPYIELPSTFDDYLAGCGYETRRQIRKKTRLLEKAGAEVQVCSGPAAVAESLDALIQLHTARWADVNQSGNMNRPGFVRFLQRICAAPPAESTPRLYLMKHEQKFAAALLVFHTRHSALAYSIGRDPASPISNLSPGLILFVSSIRFAIEEGLRHFDFLRGDEGYKSHLTKSARLTVTLLVGRSASAAAYLHALRLKDWIKQRFPTSWDRLISSRDQRLRRHPIPASGAKPDLEGEANAQVEGA
jgi:CelD/BcsL family acetyltransferase involved in cellulose biosynthesis